jgi:predicted DCC family thiol-disulfide oxidoreductase YuxK
LASQTRKQLIEDLKRVFSLDLRSLTCFRILLGLVLLVDLLDKWWSLESFFTDFGMIPREAIVALSPKSLYYSIHFFSGHLFFQNLLFILNTVIILAFIFGYQTRIMTFLCWFFYVSMINRDPIITHGGDVVVRMILFWSMLIPLGIHYSMDAALQKHKYPARQLLSPGTIGLTMQILLIYFFSGLLKNDTAWNGEGNAIAYALQLENFASPIGIFLRKFPVFLQFLTYSTALLEALGPVIAMIAFQKPLSRIIVIFAFMSLHFGIFLAMNIGLFPWMCLAAWTVFLPGEFWDWIERKLPKQTGAGVHIYFDADCGFCKKAVYILRHLLMLGDAKISEGQLNSTIFEKMQQENSWIVMDVDGRLTKGYDAFLILIRQSNFFRMLYPMLRSKPVHFIGSKIYRWVSTHRGQAGRITAPLQWNQKMYHYSKFSVWFACLSIIIILLNNIASIIPEKSPLQSSFSTPEYLMPIQKILRIDQKWNMFAPHPTRTNKWIIISGKRFSGQEASVIMLEPLTVVDGQEVLQQAKVSHRWTKLLTNMTDSDYEDYVKFFGRYICRKMKRDMKDSERLETFSIKVISQKTSLGAPNEKKERIAWQHQCR